MIEGTNITSIDFDYDLAEKSYEDKKPKSTNAVIDNLERRRRNVLNGGVNCIPFPFERFRSEIPGTEQGQYIVVTANQKVGKTNFANFVYLFNVLDYCYEHQDKCSCHIFYFALEESISKIIERYMSYLLYKLDNLRLSTTDLRSTSADYPVPEEVIDLLRSEKYQKRFEFFEKCVQFDTENTNPTGILRVCEDYAKSVGEYERHEILSRSDISKKVEVFDSYKQHNPNHYKICIIDHIGLVDREQGFRTKDSIDKASEYCVKYLRNRYNYTCVVIQQQASDAEGLEAIKQKKMLPTVATLGDSKYTARDANLILGLFDPSRFGLANWLGYKIMDPDGIGLRNYGRFLYVIANRDDESNGICPLFFDGAVCNFEELPKPDDVNAITKYYQKAANIKSYRQTKKLSSLILSVFRKRK